MKKTYPFLLAVVALFLLASFVSTTNFLKKYFSKEANFASIKNAEDYLFKLRRNQKTGTIDPSDVLRARLAIDNLKKNHISTPNSTQSLGLSWTELGPDNLGGRTRAILVDKNNANRIFAGAASGGLWVSNNAGSTWAPCNDQLADFAVTCITQSANGDIYFGTGEGGTNSVLGNGNNGIIGGGIWKSTNDGNTFNVLSNTVPATNSVSSLWNTNFNKLACDPTDSNRIYASTIQGLYISQDAGNTWTIENNTRQENSYDVQVGSDGSVFAAIDTACYISATGLPGAGSFTKVDSLLPTGNGFSLAIAPQDPNYLYASIADSLGGLIGIYQSTDKGVTWIDIGPGGSLLFNPFGVPGATSAKSGQGLYDNIIAVYPNNKYKILLGGTSLYSWLQTNTSTSGAGQWTNISDYYAAGPADNSFAGNNQHAIAFTTNNPSIVYFGDDGGVYKSFDGATTFAPYNRDYNIAESFSVAYPSYENNGEGCISGTNNSMSFYLSGTVSPVMDATQIGDGISGGDCEISTLNTSAFFASVANGALSRSSDRGNSFANFYSIRLTTLAQPNFVVPTALYENANDSLSHDSLIYTADKNYNTGDTIHTISSRNNNTAFSHILTAPLDSDSTLKIQDPVQVKLVVGYSGSDGVWMTLRSLDFTTTPYWYQICKDSGSVTTMAFTPDGDHLFVGTDDGQLERVDSLSKILNTDVFPVHGVPYLDSISGDITSPQHVETTKVLITSGSQVITRIAVDPNNGNNIVVTMGNYGNPSYIVFSNNALSSSPTFTTVQGNLPLMPVYAALITKDNSKEVIVGTEHGVWGTSDITQGTSTVWTQENNNQLPNAPVMMLRQQTLPYWWSSVNNSGKIYAATYGRGLWSCGTYFHPFTTGIPENSISKTSMVIYPDPMVGNGTVAFSTNKSENVIMNIYDLEGRLIKTMNVPTISGQNRIPFTTEGFTAGTYLLSITGTTAHLVSRFVVIK